MSKQTNRRNLQIEGLRGCALSYPVYLIHQNIGFLIEFQMMKYNGNWNYGIAGCAVVITIGCGICLYYLFEKPVQSLITGNGN